MLNLLLRFVPARQTTCNDTACSLATVCHFTHRQRHTGPGILASPVTASLPGFCPCGICRSDGNRSSTVKRRKGYSKGGKGQGPGLSFLISYFLKMYFIDLFYCKVSYTEKRKGREEDLPSNDTLPK